MDGSVCATLFLAAGGPRENIYYCVPDHEYVDEKVAELLETWDGPIILADISISHSLAEMIAARNKDVYLFDHHKSAIPLVEFDFCEIDVDNTRCGSKVFYDWLVKEFKHTSEIHKILLYKDLVEAADDIDRWIHAIPRSMQLATLHRILGQKLFVDRFTRDPGTVFSSSEKFMLQIEEEKKEEFIQGKKKSVQVFTKTLDGHEVKIGIVVASDHESELGHAIYDDPELGVDIVIMISGKKLSMRSRSGCPVDLSKLTHKYGGGGHRNAAGCQLSKVIEKDLIELVAEKLRL
jgi:oligoribonuclease NrnB/cAMP/cGMP phosphodiesterase (DHH superfamily)